VMPNHLYGIAFVKRTIRHDPAGRSHRETSLQDAFPVCGTHLPVMNSSN